MLRADCDRAIIAPPTASPNSPHAIFAFRCDCDLRGGSGGREVMVVPGPACSERGVLNDPSLEPEPPFKLDTPLRAVAGPSSDRTERAEPVRVNVCVTAAKRSADPFVSCRENLELARPDGRGRC
mmetsp:Transcript_51498/g.103289  ORF Transcript_51498/g.103289 Transcript_51498/m.103289 type:complete len:125 (+) Transcript_51498:348-722(+)